MVVGVLAAVGVGPVLPRSARALDPDKSLSECTVEVLGIRDGLTGSSIRSLAQTADGYLWIAAEGGLRRYDGAAVARLDSPDALVGVVPGPGGLPLAVSRIGEPACVQAGAFVPCGSRPPGGEPVRAMDRLPRDGDLWLAGDGGSLLRLRGRQLQQVVPPSDHFGTIYAIFADARGRLWVGSNRGLFVGPADATRGQQFQLHADFEGPLPGPVRAIFEGRGGVVWVLSDERLHRVTAGGTETFLQPEGLALGWRSQGIEDRDGNVWFGTRSGLIRFRNGSFDLFTRRDGLPDDDVSAVLEDREGSLWVGTRSGALAQFTDRTVVLRAGPPGLRDLPIESLCEDHQGALWFGTWTGLSRWMDGREQRYDRAAGLPSDQVNSVLPGDGDEVWVGTRGGLARWRGGKIETPVPLREPVMSLGRGRSGILYIGTETSLWTWRQGHLQRVPTAPGVSPGQIRGIQEDDQGIVWATTHAGLHRIEGGQLVQAPALPGDAGRADRALYRDDDGTLWFGAGGTLVRRRAGRWQLFSTADGMPGDPIYQALADGQGYLWLTTSRALLRIEARRLEEIAAGRPGRVAAVSFDTSEDRRELAARRSRTPGAWRARDGRIWFATLRGAASLDPRRVPVNRLPPPVLIEKAVVDGRPVWSQARPPGASTFPPGPGNLEFHFAGVTLVEPQKAVHSYRLLGFDRDWIEAGARRVAYYTNIPAGRYRFEVRASNADGVWNEAGAALELRLLPHVYRTTGFYMLMAVIVGAAALAAYRLRLGRLRGQFLAVIAERNRMARELHDSLLQGMAAAALEIGNVRDRIGPGPAASRLEAVENALSASLAETRRLVWNLRDGAGPSEDLGQALWRLAARLSEGRPISCTVDTQGRAWPLPQAAQTGLFRIAQEALTNAIKHARPGRVDLQLSYEPETVVLSVIDDGCGFDETRAADGRTGHFGLLGMRERARALGAQLVVTSRPGRGTAVILRLRTNAKGGIDAGDG